MDFELQKIGIALQFEFDERGALIFPDNLEELLYKNFDNIYETEGPNHLPYMNGTFGVTFNIKDKSEITTILKKLNQIFR